MSLWLWAVNFTNAFLFFPRLCWDLMAIEVGVGSLPLAMSDCDKDPSRFQSGLIVFLEGRLVKNSMLWQISELLLFPSPVRSPRGLFSVSPLREPGRAPQGKTNKMFKFPRIF